MWGVSISSRLKIINQARCIGCYSCMMACARTYYKTVSIKNSAIVIRTSGGIENAFVCIVCRACTDPPCAEVCPRNALSKRKGGGVALNKELCDGCEKCMSACIIGAIHMDGEQKAIVCRHCGVCTGFCPHEVLEMIKVEDAGKQNSAASS